MVPTYHSQQTFLEIIELFNKKTGIIYLFKDSCAFGSTKYFLLCGLGGFLSCGITHTMVTPLDLVKCRLQVDQAKYKNVLNGFKVSKIIRRILCII